MRTMKKIVLYDHSMNLHVVKRVLMQKEEKGECFVSIFCKKEQLIFYLEEIGWDIDILIFHFEKNFDEATEFLDFCRKRARWMKIFLLSDVGVIDNMFIRFFPDGLLILPAGKDRFLQVLDFLEYKSDREYQRCLTLSTKGKLYRIPYRELIFVESEGHYVTLRTWDEQIKVYGKLDDIIQKLPVYFRRCHKSYVINLHYIRQLEMYKIKLGQNNEWIPVSQKYYKDIKKYMDVFGKLEENNKTKR